MQNKALVFLTGVPGTGKSFAGRNIAQIGNSHGLATHFTDDYPLLKQFAEDHRQDTQLVTWQETDDHTSEFFSIVPSAYQEISTFIAASIARTVPKLLSDFDVVVMEAARGAGAEGKRDRYGKHLFEPFLYSLNTLMTFANIEMQVKDHKELLERVQKRFEKDPTAAPPFVVEKYISPTEGALSSTEEAREYGKLFAINAKLDNSGDRDATRRELETIMVPLFSRLGKEI